MNLVEIKKRYLIWDEKQHEYLFAYLPATGRSMWSSQCPDFNTPHVVFNSIEETRPIVREINRSEDRDCSAIQVTTYGSQDFKFYDVVEGIETDGFLEWLFESGTLHIHGMMSEEQADQVSAAVELIRTLERNLNEEGLIEYY